MQIIGYRAKKNAAFAMHYRLRKSLISCFKAKIVPINKITIMAVYYISILILAIYTTNKIMDFRQQINKQVILKKNKYN